MDKYYFEFTKLYGRLMRLELRIKQQLIKSLLPVYKENILNTFNKFFTNKNRLERYQTTTGNIILSILKNPQITDINKFKKLINKLYLSDILVLVLNCKQFQLDEISNAFYYKKPEKYSFLINAKQDLQNLRNSVAHYNFKDYEQNKNVYNEALLIFEEYIGSSFRGFILPKFNEKPSIKTILLHIKQYRPDLFDINLNKDDEYEYYYNKHRILLDLCDEISMLNGYNIQELPSPWTILRQMYLIKKEDSKSQEQQEVDINLLPLFKTLSDYNN